MSQAHSELQETGSPHACIRRWRPPACSSTLSTRSLIRRLEENPRFLWKTWIISQIFGKR